MQYDRLTSETKLAELLKSLDKRIKSVETKGSGTIAWMDDSGVETIIGELPDGTIGFQPFVGDIEPPPVASAPTAVPGPGFISVAWDGLFVDSAEKPRDFDNLNVIGHKVVGGSVVQSIAVGIIRNPLDACLVGTEIMPVGETWEFSFVSEDYNGNLSDFSLHSALVTQKSFAADVLIDDALAGLEQDFISAQNAAVSAQQAADAAQDSADSAAQAAIDAANIADGKGVVYTQSTAPVIDYSGLWINTAEGNKAYTVKNYPDTIVEDFEDATLILTQGVVTSSFTRSTDAAKFGTYGLRHATGTAHHVLQTTTSYGINPDATYEVWVRLEAEGTYMGGLSIAGTANSTLGYQVFIDSRRGAAGSTAGFQIRKDAVASPPASMQLPAGHPIVGQWYRITAKLISTGVTASLYLEDGTLLGTINSTDTAYTSGVAGVYSYSTVSTDNFKIVYPSDAWLPVQDAGVQSAADAAAAAQTKADQAFNNAATAAAAAGNAQTTADGKNRAWYQNDAPAGTSHKNGDQWFDTNDGNKLYLWTGSSWVSFQDAGISAAQGTANTALTSANGKNKIYYQTSMPTGGTYITGDTWFDTDDGNKIYVHNGTTFVVSQDASIATAQTTANTANTTANSALTTANSKTKTYFQTAQPGTSGNTTGDIWFDTDDGNKVYVWNGTAWTTARDSGITAAQTSADGKNTIFYQTAAPATSGRVTGDTWFDTDDGNKIYVWNGSAWAASQDAAIAAAQITANTANTTANSKTKTFIQGTSPTATTVGDIWIDTANGNVIKTWEGSSWVTRADAAIASAQGTANTALTSANGKNKVYYQTAMPTGGTYILGDTWFDTDDGNKIYVHNGATFVASQDASIATAQTAANNAQTTANTAVTTANSKTKTYFQTAQPGTSGNTVGDTWFDTDDSNKVYVWNGSSWASARDAGIASAASAAASAQTAADSALSAAQAAQAVADGAIRTFYQSAAPTGLNDTTNVGDLWFDTDDGQAYRWNGTAWVIIEDNSIAAALAAAQNAQTTADGKITSYYQPGQPAVGEVGDLWFDTDDKNKPYYCSSISPLTWTAVRDGTIADAQSTANTALTSANGKNRVFYQTAMPTGSFITGDTWFDTDDGNKIYVYNGTTFVNAQDASIAVAQTTANAKSKTYFQTAQPGTTGNTVGDTWFDTDDGNKPYVWNGSAWTSAQDATIAAAQGTANTALTSANGKNKVYYQTAMPTGGTYIVGDTWFDTDDGNKIYVHNGTTFVNAQDTAIGTAQTTANSKTKTFIQGTAPTATTTGDIWIDTANGNVLKTWEGSSWVTRADAAIATAQAAANAAQTSANGRNKVYYQTAQPSGGTYILGDTWFDTDDGNQVYIYNGSTWAATDFGSSAIADLAITNAKIADATIQSAKIGSVDAGTITVGTLSAARIGADSITATHIASDAITANELAAGSITAAKGQISDLAVTTAKINDAAITTAKIANLAVTNAQIADATIASAKIAALDAAKITTGTLDAGRIGANTIAANKIFVGDLTNLAADGNFTDTAKANWVGSGTVTVSANEPNRLRVVTAASGNNDQANNNTLQVTAGEQIYGEVWVYGEPTNVGNGGPNMHMVVTSNAGVASWPSFQSLTRAAVSGQWVLLKGTLTIPANAKTAKVELAVSYSADAVGNIYYFREVSVRRKATGNLIVDGAIQAGSAIIATGAIGTAQIGDAQITTAKIANLAVTDAQIATATITSAKIANLDAAKITTGTLDANRIGADTITASHIASDAITANELAANSITAAKGQISDAAITTAKIADAQITTAKIANLAVTDAQIATATITSAKIANLDAAKITTGYLDSQRINAGTIDATKLNVSLGGTNLIPNSSFEADSDSNGLADGWSVWTRGTGDAGRVFTNVRVAGHFPGSTYAQKVTSTTVTNTEQSSIQGTTLFYIGANAKVALSIYGRASVAGNFSISMRCENDAGTYLGDAQFTAAFTTTVQRFSGIVTTPSGTTKAKITITTPTSLTNGHWFEVDGVQAEVGDIVSSWGPMTAELLPGTIKAEMIAANAIQAGSAIIGTGAIGTAQIGNLAVGTAQIADTAITTAKIANLAVTDAQIATATITSAKIANLDAAKITTGTLDAARIGADTITATHIASNAITVNELAANSITAAKGQISDLAVTTAKIDNVAITSAKIADLAVTDAKIADATITNAKIANLDAAKITTGTLDAGRIGANSILTAHLSSGNIDASVLSAGSITATEIGSKSITTDKLVISSTDNLVVEADFGNNGTSWDLTPDYKAILADRGRGGLPALRISGSTSEVATKNLVNRIAVDPTNRYRATIWVRSTEALAADKVKMYLRCYTTATAYTDIVAVSSPALVVDTWTKVTGMVPALPAGTVSLEVIVAAQNSATGTWTEIDYVSLTRAMDATLVVDGSITAASISASAIGAQHISANAITASALDVDGLWADESWLGVAGASSLKLSSSSTTTTALDPETGYLLENQTFSEVNSQGLRVYNLSTLNNPVSGDITDLQEIIKLGTFDEDFFAINKAGIPQITMNAEGEIAAQKITVGTSDNTGQLLVNGIDLGYEVVRRPSGMLAWGQVLIGTNMSVNSGEIGLFEIAFDGGNIPARMAEYSVNPFLIETGGAGIVGLRLRYTTDGTAPNLTSPIIGYNYNRVDVAGLTSTGDFTRIIGSNNGEYIRVLLCLYVTGTWAKVYSGTGQTHIYSRVLDLGETIDATAIATTAGGTPYTGSPAVPPSAPKVTKTVEWGYTGVRSYTGSNATYAYNTAKGYQGLSPAGYGNLKSIYTFPNTITSTISGSTINGIWLYAYFEHWYNGSGGTARFRLHGNTSLPSTNNLSSNGMNSGAWPRAAGRWVAVPSSLWAGFLAGTWKGFGFEGDSTYGTYGIANNARIRIKYTK